MHFPARVDSHSLIMQASYRQRGAGSAGAWAGGRRRPVAGGRTQEGGRRRQDAGTGIVQDTRHGEAGCGGQRDV